MQFLSKLPHDAFLFSFFLKICSLANNLICSISQQRIGRIDAQSSSESLKCTVQHISFVDCVSSFQFLKSSVFCHCFIQLLHVLNLRMHWDNYQK